MNDLPPVHRPIVKLSDIDPMEFAVGICEALKEVVFAVTQPAARGALAACLEQRAEVLCKDYGRDRALMAEMLASVLDNHAMREKQW